MLLVEIELNLKTTPCEFPKSLLICGSKKYFLLGLLCFYNNKQRPELNHFIFKLFDGKNFYDVDNLRKRMDNSINNELNYSGNFFCVSLAVYILNDF